MLKLLAGVIPWRYVVLVGHFGNHHALHRARQCALHLSSKLRCDAALSCPSAGPYAGRGPQRKYGRKVDADHIPLPYLPETTREGPIPTRLSQAPLLHKAVAHPLHVVLLVKTTLRPQAHAHVILGSSAWDLACTPRVD